MRCDWLVPLLLLASRAEANAPPPKDAEWDSSGSAPLLLPISVDRGFASPVGSKYLWCCWCCCWCWWWAPPPRLIGERRWGWAKVSPIAPPLIAVGIIAAPPPPPPPPLTAEPGAEVSLPTLCKTAAADAPSATPFIRGGENAVERRERSGPTPSF